MMSERFLFVKRSLPCYHCIAMSLIENRKARFNFEFQESLDAGLELIGLEVKSLRMGRGSLDGAYISIRPGRTGNNEAFIIGMNITPFQEGNTPSGYDPRRPRRLLLTKKQIADLAEYEHTKGLTIVPVSVYNKNHKLKLSIAVARGKKQFDKRETIKKRDQEREARRALNER